MTYDQKPLAMRVLLTQRSDDKRALGVTAPEDLNTRDWKIGDTLVLTVIGIERVGWEGTAVL